MRLPLRRSLCAIAAIIALASGSTSAIAMPSHAHRPINRHRPTAALGPVVHGASEPRLAPPQAAAPARPAPLVWPSTTARTVALPGVRAAGQSLVTYAGRVQAATVTRQFVAVTGTPFAVAAASVTTPSFTSVSGVTVRVLSRAQSAAYAGSVAVELTRSDGTGAGVVAVRVPAAFLNSIYGADYAGRVSWVQLPVGGGASAARAVGAARSGSSLIAAPTVSGTPTVLVARSGATAAADGSGDFGATPLRASSAWQVSTQTGSFSWSYPLRVPAAPAGPAPDLALAYDSGSVDGLTENTNNQASGVGRGWELAGAGGYIERSYVPCSVLGLTGAGAGDECWDSDNATISIDGHSEAIIRDQASGQWHLADDDGSRIQRFTGAANGDTDAGMGDGAGETWVLTRTDGTQYFFGRTTASTLVVPIHGGSVQAWRWNLDLVSDTHGNTENLKYATESNRYLFGADPTASPPGGTPVTYERASELTEIDYGMRAGISTVRQKVVFSWAERCAPGATCSAGDATTHTAAAYPDTPWDEDCLSTTCTLTSPSFWTSRMLSKVQTMIVVGGSWTTVEQWTLAHSFPAASGNDASTEALWLDQVTHTGHAGSASISLDPVVFGHTSLNNRVIAVDGLSNLPELRINTVTTETGASIAVTYSAVECTAAIVANLRTHPQTNSRRCYPQWWSPQSPPQAPQLDFFNKYVVTAIDADPQTGGVTDPVDHTGYAYTGVPAWRFDSAPGTEPDQRTWSVFAGYSSVEVRHGSTASNAVTTDYTYLQGLDGDPNGPITTPTSSTRSVTVTASSGAVVRDSLAAAGQVLETATRNGSNGTANGASSTPVLSDAVSVPWVSAATATAAPYTYRYTDPADPTHTVYTGTLTRAAYLTGDASTTTWVPLSDGTRRTTSVTDTYDPTYGRLLSVSDVTPDAGSTCTRTRYADNTTAWMLSYVSESHTVGVACTQTPSYPTDAISDIRTSYDGTAWGSAPSVGDVTQTQVVTGYTGTGASATPTWLTTATSATSDYDALGRRLHVTDELGRVTSIAYTPTGADANTLGPVTQTVTTNPLGWTTTTAINPAWGVPTSITDVNGAITTAGYDPLGRLTQLWRPDRPQSSHATSPSVAYAYTERASGPLAVATSAINANGNAVTSYVLYDGLQRAIQTQSPAEYEDSVGNHGLSGTDLTDTLYDSTGRVASTDNLYYSPNVSPSATLFVPTTTVPNQTINGWDGASRMTASTEYVDGAPAWTTSYAYPGGGVDRTDMTPPAGGTPTTTYTDSRGHTSSLTDYDAATPTGTGLTTTYRYDPRGDLTAMTDSGGSIWSWSFDVLGRIVQAVDPDTGTTSSSYDTAGRLSSTTIAARLTSGPTAQPVQLSYTYDALDRKTGEYLGSDTTSSGTQLAAWTYDPTLGSPAVQYKGQAGTSTRYVGSTAGTLGDAYTRAVTGYDIDDRPTGTTLTVPTGPLAGTYANQATYSPDGTLATQTDPAVGPLHVETINYFRSELDNIVEVGGNEAYLVDATFTHTNQLSQHVLGDFETEVDLNYFYDDATRLTESLAVTGASTNFKTAEHHYTYDNAGDITADLNGNPQYPATTDDLQCYSYDHLQRLTAAWTPTTSQGCATTPSASGAFGGPAPYWRSYTYDADGNRHTTVDHSTTGAGVDTRVTSTYSAAQPHVLTSTATQTAPTGTTSFGAPTVASYAADAAGDTTARPGQALTWTPEGTLATDSIGTGATKKTQTTIYDADGTLLERTDPTTGTTLYLGDTELTQPAGTAGTAAQTAVRTYTADGTPIAERTGAARSTLYWLVTDPHGTATDEVHAVSDYATTHRYLDPFGNPRTSTPPNWTSSHGYLNAPTSTTTTLTHLGARDYDPTLGRFISADPLLDTQDPQSIDGYGYADNNPISNADSTGTVCTNGFDGSCYNAKTGTHSPTVGKDDCPTTDATGNCVTTDLSSNPGPTTNNYYKDGTLVPYVFTSCNRDAGCKDPVLVMTGNLNENTHPAVHKNYCGGFSWLCTATGINQAANCIANPSPEECVSAFGTIAATVFAAGKAVQGARLILDAISAAQEGAAVAADTADGAAGDAADDPADATCGGNSFTPDTTVVMADGSTKPLDQVKVGDKVEATDTKTGKTSAQTVTTVWVNHDTDLMNVTITAGGKTSTIQATQHHLFWDQSRRAWVEADHLAAGDQLRTDKGQLATVTSTVVVAGASDMWDLTVINDHDFYVVTTTANVLVHNCPSGDGTSRGSTGRTEPANLNEQLAMQQAQSDPAAGRVLTNITMNDSRWPASEGWVKMQQNVNGSIIHYVYNTTTGVADDFKYVGG